MTRARGTSRTAPRVLVLLLVLAVTATACGSRLDAAEREHAVAAAAGGGGSGGSGAEPGEQGGGGVAGPATGAGSPTGEQGGSGGGGEGGGGDGGGPSAPGSGGGGDGGGGDAPVGGAGGSCTPAADHTEVGVSASEVRAGNVSTITGPIPGFGRTGQNGVKAYFNMVNSRGGVCGRQLTLVTSDDRLQAATNRAETEKLARQVLALVGNTTVVDDGGAAVVSAEGVPDIGLAISEARIRSPYNFSPNPIDLSSGGNGSAKMLSWFREEYGVSRAAIVYPAQASARNRGLAYQRDFREAGINVVRTYEVAVTETNYASQVADMRQRDVDIVITTLEVNGMARLAQTFGTNQPTVPFYGAQAYGKLFLQLAGSAADGTKIGVAYAVPEEGDSNPAIAAFDEWYARTNPGQDVDFFAIMGWIAADIFVRALQAAGPAPTRDGLLEQLGQMTSYTGDGLVGNLDLPNKAFPKCYQILEVVDGAWTKRHPSQGFQC